MTAHKHLKERIRARMARTGESYTTARRHVLNALPPPSTTCSAASTPTPTPSPGCWPTGACSPPTPASPCRRPWSSGPAAGSGAGYILWEFKAHDLRSLVFGFRNSWQYPDRWARKACQRLGVPAAVHETGSARKADAELRAAVGQGVPAIAWADQQAPRLPAPAGLAGGARRPPGDRLRHRRRRPGWPWSTTATGPR